MNSISRQLLDSEYPLIFATAEDVYSSDLQFEGTSAPVGSVLPLDGPLPRGISCFSLDNDLDCSIMQSACLALANSELRSSFRLFFTHHMHLRNGSTETNRKRISHYVLCPSTKDVNNESLQELHQHNWLQSHNVSASPPAKVLGQWAADSSRIRDIRMRWLMMFMAECYEDESWPMSDRMHMNDIYNWWMEGRRALEDLKEEPFRAAFVHRILCTALHTRPSDVMKKDDITLSIEDLFPWLEDLKYQARRVTIVPTQQAAQAAHAAAPAVSAVDVASHRACTAFDQATVSKLGSVFISADNTDGPVYKEGPWETATILSVVAQFALRAPVPPPRTRPYVDVVCRGGSELEYAERLLQKTLEYQELSKIYNSVRYHLSAAHATMNGSVAMKAASLLAVFEDVPEVIARALSELLAKSSKTTVSLAHSLLAAKGLGENLVTQVLRVAAVSAPKAQRQCTVRYIFVDLFEAYATEVMCRCISNEDFIELERVLPGNSKVAKCKRVKLEEKLRGVPEIAMLFTGIGTLGPCPARSLDQLMVLFVFGNDDRIHSLVLKEAKIGFADVGVNYIRILPTLACDVL